MSLNNENLSLGLGLQRDCVCEWWKERNIILVSEKWGTEIIKDLKDRFVKNYSIIYTAQYALYREISGIYINIKFCVPKKSFIKCDANSECKTITDKSVYCCSI